jgi:hypothetical protein
MTLLIGTKACSKKPHVVITADGLSTTWDGVTRRVSSERVQKIFPIPDVPIVVAHYGENVICGRTMDSFLGQFVRECPERSTKSIDDIAKALGDYADMSARSTLGEIGTRKIIGFWVAGIVDCRRYPELVEVYWKRDPESGRIACKTQVRGNLALAGDRGDLISHFCRQPVDGMFHFEKIPKKDINYALKFHARLYRIAETKQTESADLLFGGHRHQLTIGRDGWKWTVPPIQSCS